MNDRELLELAAKAVGIEYTVRDDNYYKTHKFFGLWLVIHGEPYEGQRRYWNPLRDDGDALRLAVKLRLTVSWDRFDDDDYATATPPHTNQGYDCIVD